MLEFETHDSKVNEGKRGMNPSRRPKFIESKNVGPSKFFHFKLPIVGMAKKDLVKYWIKIDH
jgi:hypothetical protein